MHESTELAESQPQNNCWNKVHTLLSDVKDSNIIVNSQSASSLESVQSSSPSQCHASFIHSRDVTQRNWLTAHSVGGRTTPADASDSLERRSASAAVQFCSSELSWQSMSPSHRQTSGMHCWLPHCQWSLSHFIGSVDAAQNATISCLTVATRGMATTIERPHKTRKQKSDLTNQKSCK